ncbi:flagellar biosynthetic protein FliO [Clostridium thermarum]|uniref:flagellar biosynthetic protein FliO n=1 Tax=Clostridium thermarum TaxID=1716543 RepID=UPI0011216A1C|nr:flagellar biosynthetic protein FliO [Clostridium thermarum]
MDKNTFTLILQLVFFLPFIIFLIFLSMKLGGSKLQNFQKGKFIKVFERTTISKENSLIVVQIGSKGYVMASTTGKLEIIKELEDAELAAITAQKAVPQFSSLQDLYKKIGLKRKGTL